MKHLLPTKPENEKERLELLYACSLLDTPPEPEYDDYTFLAAQIFETPVALISLIDENRQWFKSKVGTHLSETPRDLAFCAFAILSKKTFIIEDMLLDERFANHPLVVSPPNIRFYAGAPLSTPSGHILGTLCVLSIEAQKSPEDKIAALEALARQLTAKIIGRIESRKMEEALQIIAHQQSKLLASARLSSLGEMSAGISHEINNPLAIIQGKLRKIERLISDNPLVLAEIERIDAAASRIAKTVKGLREFARDGGHDSFEIIDLSKLVMQAIELTSTRAHQLQIALIGKDTAAPINVECRSIQIVQVLVNLINNAFDALKDVEVRTITISASESADFAEIAVSDSGHGIPKQIQDKIMEAFFTTKDVGLGSSGLGLSIAKGLVESHKGSLSLDTTRPDTCFKVRLPKLQTVAFAKGA